MAGAGGDAGGEAAPPAVGGIAGGVALGEPEAAGADTDGPDGAAFGWSASPLPQPAASATATSRAPTAGRLRTVTLAVCPTASGGGKGWPVAVLSHIRLSSVDPLPATLRVGPPDSTPVRPAVRNGRSAAPRPMTGDLLRVSG